MLEKAEAEAHQKAEEQMKIKEMQHKMEIQEKELRIRELQAEIKSKPQDDANSPDVLNPANLLNLANFMRCHPDTHINWRKLGAGLGFSNQELDQIDRQSDATFEGKLNVLLRCWLQWYPGDSRGSTTFATYTQLKTALVNAGLGAVARDLPPYEELKRQHKHQ